MRAEARALALLALFALPGACAAPLPPPGHVALFIETDAPGSDDVEAADALFDTLRVELFHDEHDLVPCAECARDFPFSKSLAEPSITVTTLTAEQSVLAHVCLFRARWGCIPDGSLETWARLPPSPVSGATEATVSLTLASLGVVGATRATPEMARAGRPITRPRWVGGDPVPCRTAAQPGQACIDGIASWIGNPLVTSAYPALSLRRLVVLSPFFLDTSEVSVASFRRVLGANPPGTGHFSGRERGDNLHDYCTFTAAPGPNEDLPVNCVPWTAARAYCTALGGDLPTEAQFEVAGAGRRGRLFVWGDDPPTCDDAVWGRQDPEHAAFAGVASNTCATRRSRGLPLSTTRANVGRDVLHTRDGDVRDLGGNVAEWMKDGLQESDSICWKNRGVLLDPHCDDPLDRGFGPTRSVRGGAWLFGLAELAPARRKGLEERGFTVETGFRCARPAR